MVGCRPHTHTHTHTHIYMETSGGLFLASASLNNKNLRIKAENKSLIPTGVQIRHDKYAVFHANMGHCEENSTKKTSIVWTSCTQRYGSQEEPK